MMVMILVIVLMKVLAMTLIVKMVILVMKILLCMTKMTIMTMMVMMMIMMSWIIPNLHNCFQPSQSAFCLWFSYTSWTDKWMDQKMDQWMDQWMDRPSYRDSRMIKIILVLPLAWNSRHLWCVHQYDLICILRLWHSLPYPKSMMTKKLAIFHSTSSDLFREARYACTWLNICCVPFLFSYKY